MSFSLIKILWRLFNPRYIKRRLMQSAVGSFFMGFIWFRSVKLAPQKSKERAQKRRARRKLIDAKLVELERNEITKTAKREQDLLLLQRGE